MSKERSIKKSEKKVAAKNLKEKRAGKKARKVEKSNAARSEV
jgi:hypothetical protein